MKWIPVEKRLPKINQEVLCYFTIEKWEYFVVGKIRSIVFSRTYAGNFKHTEWVERGNDSISPTHWMPITRNGLPLDSGE